MRLSFLPYALVVSSAFALISGAARAQSAGAVDNSSVSADVTTIVVTANKREQKLSDVGATVDAIGAEQIKAQHVDSLEDLTAAVPGLNYTLTAANTPVITLRGIGFYDTSLAAYPTTSIYVDEVSLPFPVMATRSILDLERVEVLKGPQGTIFGNNATGGAINYIAAKPTKDFEAGNSLTYARFNTVTEDGYVSGPISNTLSARLAVKYSHGDGWQYDYARAADGNNAQTNYFTGRLLLDWRPSDRLSFVMNINGWLDKSPPQSPVFLKSQPQTGAPDAIIDNYPQAPADDRAASWGPTRPRADDHFWQVALRGTYAMTEHIDLISITSYADYKMDEVQEGDGTHYEILDLNPRQGSVIDLSQELRLTNGSASGFRWLVGANFSRDDTFDSNQIACSDGQTCGAAQGAGFNTLNFRSGQDMRNYAGFGNVEYDVSSNVTLKGGVRYTEADRIGTFCSTGPSILNGIFDGIAASKIGAPASPILPGQCFPLLLDGQPSRVPYTAALYEHNVSWRAGLDWKPQDGLLLYTNVSKGYKAGSFPTLSASSVAQFKPVTQESVLAYEAGVKSELFDHRVSLNAAAYYYDYKDKQLKVKVLDPFWGLLDELGNIPKSSVRGAELEIAFRPWHQLSFTSSAAYTDATIDEFVGISGNGVVGNYAGTPVPYTPKWQLAEAADYRFDLGSQLVGSLGITVTSHSRSSAVIGELSGLYSIDPYTLVDLRAAVASRDGRWQVALFGRNVTNKYYWTSTSLGNDTIVRYAGLPPTFGISLNVKF